jgi:hypothetical protein
MGMKIVSGFSYTMINVFRGSSILSPVNNNSMVHRHITEFR